MAYYEGILAFALPWEFNFPLVRIPLKYTYSPKGTVQQACITFHCTLPRGFYVTVGQIPLDYTVCYTEAPEETVQQVFIIFHCALPWGINVTIGRIH